MKKKGFTLLEILIATTIFATLIVLTFGVVSAAASYQSKLRLKKNSIEEARRITEMITRDIRSSSDQVVFQSGSVTNKFAGGFAILRCLGTCQLSSEIFPSDLTTNAIIVSSKQSYKIYSNYEGKIYFSEIFYKDITDQTLSNSDMARIYKNNNIISKSTLELDVRFSGYAPSNLATFKSKPYLNILAIAKTAKYDNLKVENRSKVSLRTMVVGRKY